MKRLLWISLALLVTLAVALSACSAPTPEVITIIETVERVIEKEGETITIVETQEVIVTATPEPTPSPYDENAVIEVWVDAARMPQVEAWRDAFPEKAHLINVTQADRGAMANQILLWNNIGEGWPDVVFGEPRFGALWSDAAHDFVADLSQWVPQEVIDSYGDNLNECYYAGRLVCLRHDLAQMHLWYDQTVVDAIGAEIPATWPEFLDLAKMINTDYPGEGYVLGSVGTSNEWLFRAGECPVVYEADLGHVTIFDPEDPKCVRAAELLDELWELDVLLASPYGGEIVEKFGNHVVMLPHASWYGQHVMKPNYPENLQAAGQVGAALLPKWPDQDANYTGAWGGSGWIMSKHTKNPQLAAELIIWLATGPWHETDATTFPAYPPANAVWGANLASDAFYLENPFPVMEEMAPNIWMGITQGRMTEAWWNEYNNEIVNPLVNGERSAVEGLQSLHDKLVELAGPLGFEVVSP